MDAVLPPDLTRLRDLLRLLDLLPLMLAGDTAARAELARLTEGAGHG